MTERKNPTFKQTIPMGAQSKPAEQARSTLPMRSTQPAGTPREATGLPRDTIKDPPRDAASRAAAHDALLDAERAAADTRAFVQASQGGAGVAALRALSAEAAAPAPAVTPAPGEAYRGTPSDERATLPRSAKSEARAVVVPAAPVPSAPVGSKVDVSRADLRRAPTQKITRRPNEYIPPDDSDVLGPAPGARPPPGVLAGPRPRPVVAAPAPSASSSVVYALLAIVCVCAVAGTVTWAIFRGRATPPPAPAPRAVETVTSVVQTATPVVVPALPILPAVPTVEPAATATAAVPGAPNSSKSAQPAPTGTASTKPPRDRSGLIFD